MAADDVPDAASSTLCVVSCPIDTEIELIAANAKGPCLRDQIGGEDTTGEKKEQQEKSDQLVLPYRL